MLHRRSIPYFDLISFILDNKVCKLHPSSVSSPLFVSYSNLISEPSWHPREKAHFLLARSSPFPHASAHLMSNESLWQNGHIESHGDADRENARKKSHLRFPSSILRVFPALCDKTLGSLPAACHPCSKRSNISTSVLLPRWAKPRVPVLKKTHVSGPQCQSRSIAIALTKPA